MLAGKGFFRSFGSVLFGLEFPCGLFHMFVGFGVRGKVSVAWYPLYMRLNTPLEHAIS